MLSISIKKESKLFLDSVKTQDLRRGIHDKHIYNILIK